IMFFSKAIGYVCFLFLLWKPGNLFCKFCLGNIKSFEKSESNHAGKRIGLLERILMLIGVLTMKWELIAIVIALKTVARYKELDEQEASEYFLIGSLASLLWAILITTGL